MKYNIDYEISSLIFLLVVAAFTVFHYGLKEKSHKQYFRLILITLLANALDIVTAVTISFHASVPIPVNNLLNLFYFVADVTITIHFMFYFENLILGKNKTVYHLPSLIIGTVYVALLIISPFTKLVFYFDEINGYCKGPLYYLTFIVPYIFAFFAFLLMFQYRKVIGKTRLIACATYLLVSMIGSIVQVVILPDTLLSVFGASIGMVLVAFTMEYGKLEKALEDKEQLVAAKTEAEKAREEAEAANRDKDQFLARMSHEIRTPINAILGMNEIIQKETSDESVLAYTYDVESSGKMLLSIVNDILDISKIDAGKMEIIPEEYKLRNLLRDCYVMIASRAREKGLELDFKVRASLYDQLYGDEIRIRQIAVNLLTNAVKYTDSGRVIMEVTSEETDDAFWLVISVKDTGRGIRPEDKEVLFESFRRIEEKKSRLVEGTGLGLSITKQLTDMMGGRLEVESVYGLGSSFTVYLPQIVMSETPIGEVDFSAQKTGRDEEKEALIEAPKAKVLVVDDVKTNLKVIVGLLKHTRIQMDTAMSGMECIKKVQKEHYDLIFLDHMMPEMDGIDTIFEIRNGENLNKETPVIMLTANAVQGAKEEYLEAGFAGYLSKPCKGKDLEEMLSRFLPDSVVEIRRVQY